MTTDIKEPRWTPEEIFHALYNDFKICSDKECAEDGGGTFFGTYCEMCGRNLYEIKNWQNK